jgi:hypothetical protein
MRCVGEMADATQRAGHGNFVVSRFQSWPKSSGAPSLAV